MLFRGKRTCLPFVGKIFYARSNFYLQQVHVKKGFFSRIGEIFNPAQTLALSDKIFSQYNEKLESRVNKVIGSLSSIGVTAIPLETHALIELYYYSYNIELSQLEKLPGEDNMKIYG